jgi:hypothetical protein
MRIAFVICDEGHDNRDNDVEGCGHYLVIEIHQDLVSQKKSPNCFHVAIPAHNQCGAGRRIGQVAKTGGICAARQSSGRQLKLCGFLGSEMFLLS